MEKTSPVKENITESVYASGMIKAQDQYNVYSTVNGTIDKLYVTENDLVKQGSPLILVSDKTSMINRQNAVLEEKYTDININREKLTDAKNNIWLALNKYKNDSMIYRRQQNLWDQNIGSRIELEQKELIYQNSKTSLASAQIKYNDLLRQLKFTSDQSKNKLTLTRYKENDNIIKSEIEGKVYFLFRKQGEMVNPQTALAIVGNATHFLIELQIDEYDIVKIKTGQKLFVSMDSYKGKIYEAKISKIYPLMNQNTKSFTVDAEFTKQPPVLYPNLTAEANIVIQFKENTLTIPRSYLINDSMVYISNDKKKFITTGLKDYQKVEIINGLTMSDVIYKPK